MHVAVASSQVRPAQHAAPAAHDWPAAALVAHASPSASG